MKAGKRESRQQRKRIFFTRSSTAPRESEVLILQQQ